MANYYKIVTAKAPVNIAVIKYWGKSNNELKMPINDSLSGTLNIDEMCATTSIAISSTFQSDELWLNGKRQNLLDGNHAKILIDEIRQLSNFDTTIRSYKVHIVSYNNFPTAAGLASSAAGYACLAFTLGHVYGITDLTQLSILARRGSGSACRSLFGGFVCWNKGENHESSKAVQVVDEKYWPEMKVIICVVNDRQKDISSTAGMSRSVQTSSLIKYRAEEIVPVRMQKITEAILSKDFETFANITMQDSNQFHAICLDTFPPIFYLNDASRQIIKICSIINSHYGENKVAYTFDAGPNACIYLLDDFVHLFIEIIQKFFTGESGQKLELKGKVEQKFAKQDEVDTLCNELNSNNVQQMPEAISYLIATSIGSGPKLIEEHLNDDMLKQ